MFAFFFWDPHKELFVLPWIHYPILWYSLLFAIGFLVGYFLLQGILQRYFYHFPLYIDSEIDEEPLAHLLLYPKLGPEKKFASIFLSLLDAHTKNTLEKMKKISRKKILEVLGFFFQKPSLIGGQDSSLASIRSTLDQILGSNVVSVKKKAFLITDHFLIYMIVATIIGARIGHILFYEDPKWFFFHPFDIFKVWEGGLASHGAAIAILGAVFLFSRNYLPKFYPRISFLSFMDLIVIPVSFAAVCIRVGNFFNQEILGTLSNSRVAVIFGHAADGSLPLPRHPVQIYEALGYLVIFGLLWSLSYKILWKEGKLFGLFLVLVFTLRFFIEFLKVEQSVLIQNSYVTMGQYLSLPFIVLGFISLNWNRLRRKVVLK